MRDARDEMPPLIADAMREAGLDPARLTWEALQGYEYGRKGALGGELRRIRREEAKHEEALRRLRAQTRALLMYYNAVRYSQDWHGWMRTQLPVTEVAELLGVSRQHAHRLLREADVELTVRELLARGVSADDVTREVRASRKRTSEDSIRAAVERVTRVRSLPTGREEEDDG